MRNLALVLLAMLVLPWSAAAAADSPNHLSGLAAMDAPDDDGRQVLLTWPAAQGDAVPGARYVVEASATGREPFVQVASLLASTGYQKDLPRYFGYGPGNDRMHAVVVTQAPLPPDLLARQQEERRARVRALSTAVDQLAAELAAQTSARLKDKMTNRRDGLVGEIARLSRPLDPQAASSLAAGHAYTFRVRMTGPGETLKSPAVTATPRGQWFDTTKIPLLLVLLLLAGLIMYYIEKARRNPGDLYIRPIAGLEAIDDAIGRATEMGKPIFFVHGLASMASISTIAAVNILGKIAERVAEYGTTFKVTNRDPVVLAVSQETVKEAYLKAGRPDLYSDDNVFYVSQDQFSYASAVEGMFLREKPASNFFFGYYFAEALLLTETGAGIGAIQIAGTDAYTQLPFFITTCDYTLMGEELYAASAYLSRESRLLGSVKAQDVGKGLLIAVILAGVVLSSLGAPLVARFFEIL